ncbi:hypothetical protein NMG60_11031746 [Bertholletia excelsa]
METIKRICLLFTLALCILSFFQRAESAPVVHFVSKMPKDSPPLDITCKVGGVALVEHLLKVGEDYQWRPTKNDIYYCSTVWGNLFAGWQAYDPERDTDHPTIFWTVNKAGFFLSYDHKSIGKKEADWQTE